MTTNFNC